MSRRQRRRQEQRRHSSERRLPSGRQIATGAGVTVGATLLMGGAAQAACTCTVDSLADPSDPGHTTLRDALLSAETLTNSGSTITFASGLSGTIHLGSQLPDITYPTTIQGPGAGVLAISGDDTTRLIYMGGGSTGDDVSISGLTLTHGLTQGSAARNGGAIFNGNKDLTISDSVLSGNTSLGDGTHDGYGGAICVCTGPGSLTAIDTTFSGNTAGGSGGAIYTDIAPLTINRSTFDGNQAYYRGGAVSDCCANYDSTIENSTVTGNSVVGDESTVSRAGYGGGVFTYASTGLTLMGSTVAGNHAAISGGGVRVDSTAQPIALQNTILANNTTGDNGPDVYGEVDSAFTLIQNTTDATVNETVPGSDITGQDPKLGGLASNGGATQTMAPLCGSPVIDKGSAFSLTEDQRGLTRPVELADYPNSTAAGADGSDMGAVELQTSPGTVCTPTTPTTAGPTGQRATALAKCKKKHKKALANKKAHDALTPQVKKNLNKKLKKCKLRANQLPV
jgi:predicted outer membrane repeat protein